MTKKIIPVFMLLLAFYSCKINRSNSNKTINTSAPNVLIILTDQWRAQATGYAGDPNIQTPYIAPKRLTETIDRSLLNFTQTL